MNFRSRSDRGNLPRDLAHSRCMEQCMVADLSAGLGIDSARSRIDGGLLCMFIAKPDLHEKKAGPVGGSC